MRDKVTRQCPQTTTFLKRRERRSGIEPRPFCLPPQRHLWPQNIMKEEEAFVPTVHGRVLRQSPGEIKRREVVLDPQVSPEEIKSREVELCLKTGLLKIWKIKIVA